jgi:uncharacterized membrane protein
MTHLRQMSDASVNDGDDDTCDECRMVRGHAAPYRVVDLFPWSTAMLPSPLHPAVVHFPIVLMILLPVVALGALWAIRRGTAPARAWAIPVAVAAGLTLSAWAAVETGESQGEQVEGTLGEQAVESHEEAAERFLLLSGVVLVVSAAGLLRGNIGRAARVTGTVAALGLVAAGYQVGHSGGRLVYGDATTKGLVGNSLAQTAENAGGREAEVGRAEADD